MHIAIEHRISQEITPSGTLISVVYIISYFLTGPFSYIKATYFTFDKDLVESLGLLAIVTISLLLIYRPARNEYLQRKDKNKVNYKLVLEPIEDSYTPSDK